MADNDYENYSDDDYLAELKDYVDAAKKEKEQDEAERRNQLAEMVGGYMGLWWYLRSFSASTARNIRTYAAIADREAKVAAWKSAADREKELSQYRDLPGRKDQQVMIVNEFGACWYCLPYVGKTYSLGDAQTLVPFHPNCRCTLVRVEDEQLSDNNLMAGIVSSEVINNLYNDSSDAENDTVNQEEYVPDSEPVVSMEHKPGITGEPNSAIKTYSTKTGKLQRIRIYGPTGDVVKDIDITNHGIGDPEVHDWIRNDTTGKMERQNRRKISEKEAEYIEGLE